VSRSAAFDIAPLAAEDGRHARRERNRVAVVDAMLELYQEGNLDPSSDEIAAQKAVAIIKELTAEAELGRTYLGKVVRVVNFGAFVEVLPGVEGLLHISEIDEHRINEVRDVLDEGQEVLVKVIDIDGQGRVRLSRKAILREQRGEAAEEPAAVGERRNGPDRPRGGDRGGRGRGGSGHDGGSGSPAR